MAVQQRMTKDFIKNMKYEFLPFDFSLFYIPLKHIFLVNIWSSHLFEQGSLSCHNTVTRGFGFSGLVRRTAIFSRLLRQAAGMSVVNGDNCRVYNRMQALI